MCRNWCRCKYWLTPTLPQDTGLKMFCISSRSTRFLMPADVGTGLKPRTSVGPLASDVGLKEIHLLVYPGLSLGHLPWGLARLLLGKLAITSSLGLKPPGASVLQRFLPREPPSSVCHGNVHAPCRTALGAPSQTQQWHFIGCQ